MKEPKRLLLASDSLRYFRLGLALVLLWDLIFRFLHWQEFFGPEGFLPMQYAETYFQSFWGPYSILESTLGVVGLLGLMIGLALLYLFQIYPRTLAVILYCLLTLINQRNPFILNGGDLLLRTLLLWSALLPSGNHESKWSDISGYCYALQLSSIYFLGNMLKLDNALWVKGEALFYILSNSMNSTLLGQLLTRLPALLKGASYAVLLLQGLGPLLFLFFIHDFKKREKIALIFIFFHVLTLNFMSLGLFPWISIIAWIPFLSQDFWKRFPKLPIKSQDNKYVLVRGILACLFIVLLFLTNFYRSSPFYKTLRSLGFSQRWEMFTEPKTHESWWIVSAVKNDNTVKDIFMGEREISYWPLNSIADRMGDDRHRKYFSYMEYAQGTKLPLLWARSLCLRNPAVTKLDIFLMRVDLTGEKDLEKKPFQSTICER